MRKLPTLETDRLVLRPFLLSDATVVQRLAGDRAVADTTLTIPHPYVDGLAEQWIVGHEGAWTRHEMAVFAVTEPESGLVGAISLRIELAQQRAELGYWIGVPFWGIGYATEAARAMVAFGFQKLGLHRVYAQHFTRNPSSARVMTKIGMRHEGVLREHLFRWGQPEDVAVWGLLRHELP
ncbi:MAG: GNAT family N-acetyltransferase [Gemmatimonadetes bacterium]|nr:GNAT family N-acetyltransferase [Gemmatimonadota bacterium]